MTIDHVVVDGSNIATEGRTTPSLSQLDDAVRAFLAQHPHYKNVTVVVDATFGHRIDEAEVAAYEGAVLAGELVAPPAGTIGRGDAFILQVARLANADVLSNDSFQELHAEHPWLFEPGRLWGGKPVPVVGWVFVARAPVRGVTSRKAVQAAKRATKKVDATAVTVTATEAKPAKRAGRASKAAATAGPALPAPSRARAEPTAPVDAKGRRRRRRGGPETRDREPVNDQMVYASFVVDHPVGAPVTGVVERFSSHGAYVRLGTATGYVALKSLGDPPPRSAREVLSLGEERTFTVARFDPATRSIDVVPESLGRVKTSVGRPARGVPSSEAVPAIAGTGHADTHAEEALVSPTAKKAAKKKSSAKKAPARKKKATAKKAPARKKAAAKKKSTAKKAAKKSAKKATKRKAPAKKKAAAKKKKPAAKKAAKKKSAKKAAKKR